MSCLSSMGLCVLDISVRWNKKIKLNLGCYTHIPDSNAFRAWQDSPKLMGPECSRWTRILTSFVKYASGWGQDQNSMFWYVSLIADTNWRWLMWGNGSTQANINEYSKRKVGCMIVICHGVQGRKPTYKCVAKQKGNSVLQSHTDQIFYFLIMMEQTLL